MIKKNVAITLFIIALVLVGYSIYDYSLGDEKISSDQPSLSTGEDAGNGKVGVVILPPAVEDKSNGS